MVDGEAGDGGTGSEDLTVESAAQLLEGMLPDDDAGEQRDPGATPEPKPAAKPAADATDPDDDLDLEPDADASEGSEESTDDTKNDEPGEEPGSTSQPRSLKVKVDGEEIEVTEDELLKGYSRTADYTRKTQALAEARREFEEKEVAAVRAERQALAASLADIRGVLEQVTKSEPDWDKIRLETPEEFPAAFAAWQLNQDRIQRVKNEEAKVHAAMAQDEAKAHRARVAEERTKLTQAIPEWAKTEVANKELQAVTQYARDLGYSKSDIEQVFDHRVVVLLRKAMMYDRAVAKRAGSASKPAAAPAARAEPRAMKPGAAPAVTKAGEKTSLAAAKRQLGASGDVRDAAAAIELMLGD
jgi:hypothetical protein